MQWTPITEAEILNKIQASVDQMSLPQQRLWNFIRIDSEKWSQDPWGNEGGGFWVVAIFGKTVIWYNDIEDGFNRSTYTAYGKISQYWCNQDDLEWTLERILDEIREGAPTGGQAAPPEPIF